MKITDTISVNPGKTALGHVETSDSIFRTPVIDRERNVASVNLLSLTFPTTNSGLNQYKKYDVPLRTLFATVLIATGISLLLNPAGMHSLAFSVCTISFGALLALGLFTRPAMLGASVFYCIWGALSLRAGTPEVAVFSLMFGCLIFGLTGAGKYSCDTLIRKSIKHSMAKAQQKRKENMAGYKVFHHIKY